MAKLQRATLLVMACLAVITALPQALAQCSTTLQTSAATLSRQTPRGCLAAALASGEFDVPVDASCLNDLVLNTTNTTGAACDEAGTIVSVSFKNASGCLEGEIGSATQTPKRTGGDAIAGSFVTGVNFTGNTTANGESMTVTVQNINCQLTYAIKASPKTTTAAADAANATEANTTDTAAVGASPAPTDAAAKKSSAAGLSGWRAAVVSVLGAGLVALIL